MDKFPETHKLPKLTQENLENLNSSISMMKIKFIINNFPIKETRCSDSFSSKFSQIFMAEIVPVLHKTCFGNVTGDNTFQSSITLIFKPGNHIIKKTDLTDIVVKRPHKILPNQFQ